METRVFKSRQVNLDPEPWYEAETGCRYSQAGYEQGVRESRRWYGLRHDPRPEFEPTRDPFPYVDPDSGRWAAEEGVCWPESGPDAGQVHEWSNALEWAPRREQFDTPVNPILVAFRATADAATDWLADLSTLDWSRLDFDPSPQQVDHARRVLARLTEWRQTCPS